MQQTPSSLRAGITAITKLGIAAASLWAIGAAFLVLNPQGEVEETKADIAMLDFQPMSNTQRFVTALDKLGHERPRVYNMNGNDVYFSVRSSNKRPDDLFHEYQEEFVNQGVNERAFAKTDLFNLHIPEPDTPDERVGQEYMKQIELREALLSGQMVPVAQGQDVFTMIGSITRDKAQTREQIRDVLEKHHLQRASRDFSEEFKGYRHIQAEWDNLQQKTYITAAWSSEEFDVRKELDVAIGGKLEGRPADPDVPACPGCSQLNYFAGTEAEAPFREQIFVTNQHPSSVLSFYDRALASRGWAVVTSDMAMQKAARALPELAEVRENARIYSKDKQHLTLILSRDDKGQTLVTFQTTN